MNNEVEIFKIQKPLMSTEAKPKLLIYNKDRSKTFHMLGMPRGFRHLLRDKLKCYVKAHVADNGDFVIHGGVKNQDW